MSSGPLVQKSEFGQGGGGGVRRPAAPGESRRHGRHSSGYSSIVSSTGQWSLP